MRSPLLRGSLSDSGEFRAISGIRRRFGQVSQAVIKGIGDDTAVISARPHSHLLVSTDLLVEGVHFDLNIGSFEDVGYRAAVANLSDIAAMGGIPQYLLIALAIPSTHSESDLHALYQGLMLPCREHGVELIGGDMSASPDTMFLAITIMGKIEPGRTLGRNGAKIGDMIYVTGTLGDSSAGLHALQNTPTKPRHNRHSRTLSFLINRHLHPTPRLTMGRLLSRHRLATAAIDLSDGLSGDLHHLCQESQVGAEIDSTKLPFSQPYRDYVEKKAFDPIQFALQGGEDYELLFTVSTKKHSQFQRLIKKSNCQATQIGMVTPQRSGIRMKLRDGSYRKMPKSGYEHFRNKILSP